MPSGWKSPTHAGEVRQEAGRDPRVRPDQHRASTNIDLIGTQNRWIPEPVMFTARSEITFDVTNNSRHDVAS